MQKELATKQPLKQFTAPWGWSKLDQYRTCPYRFHKLNVQKVKEDESQALKHGSEVHGQLEAYVNGWSDELPEGLSPAWQKRIQVLKDTPGVLTEASWGVDNKWLPLPNWLHPNTWLRAKSDWHRVDGDTLILGDYKTGKYRQPSEDQITLYAIVGHCFYPKVKRVKTAFWFVDQDEKPLELVYQANVLLKLRANFAQEAGKLYKEKAFEPTPGSHCRYCQFSRQKGGDCRY